MTHATPLSTVTPVAAWIMTSGGMTVVLVFGFTPSNKSVWSHVAYFKVSPASSHDSTVRAPYRQHYWWPHHRQRKLATIYRISRMGINMAKNLQLPSSPDGNQKGRALKIMFSSPVLSTCLAIPSARCPLAAATWEEYVIEVIPRGSNICSLT